MLLSLNLREKTAVIENFRQITLTFELPRNELILQLNRAPLLQPDVEATAKIINIEKNVTRETDTYSNETKITHNNKVSENNLNCGMDGISFIFLC